jgi:NACHT conflict system protein/NACHT domain-containing protein
MLGAAVVKTACKIWLKDNAIAANAAIGILEIIQAKVSDKREQRRVRNLFEDLEERVADNVLSGLAVEFRNIPENDREAAALAVADAIGKADLTSRDLFAVDLDTSRLFRAIKPLGRRYIETLSQDATELYERILHDCCAYIVAVADELPGFQADAFAELLTRHTEIMRHVDRRFDRLPMQLGGAGAETFEPTYLRLVAKQLDKVELFGVTVSDRVGNYPLSVAYVSLSISSTKQLHPTFSGLRDGMATPDRSVTSIEEALGSTKRAFIRGEAGSGKTTLLQWIAVRCGRTDFTGAMRDWNGCVPLFIRLRGYSGTDLPAPEDFLREAGRHIAHTMPLNWVHDLLRSGRAAVLVDGVDELPESQRRSAREWLCSLLLAYPNARCVVTSRPAAAAESWLSDEGFDALEIQPMTMADVDAFVSHWHAALAEGVTNTVEVERIEKSRHELTRTIRTRRHLRMLTASPLMTALICALHLDRHMQLPNDRVQLYSIALDMLLERRDTEREIHASDVKILRGDTVLLLEDLAYWLVRNGWSGASRQRVLQRLSGKLTTMHRVQAKAGDVLKHLLDRSGLLRSPVEGQIDFVHKTFQEFLAARAAVAADDIGVLVQNAHDDQWHEVILMAAAHARPQQTGELLHELLARADDEPNRYVLQALAVGCKEYAPELAPEIRQRLQNVAAELLPPKRISQAVALAQGGDLVLDLLSGRTDYTVQEAIATIRMAATIGGDHAMSIIANCANKHDRRIEDEVDRAWPKFDPHEFARRVIAEASRDRPVRVNDPVLLPALANLDPTHLTCRFVHGYGDIDYVLDTPSLTWFELLDTKLTNLARLPDLSVLERLNLRAGTRPVDISPIARCPSLRSLNLPYSSIADDRELRGLVRITQLEFGEDVPVTHVMSKLSEELRLQRFGLWSARSMENIDDLLVAPQLADLDFLLLSQTEKLESIAGVEQWAETLTGIYLHSPCLTDVERLSGLKLLTFANLAKTPLTSLDFFSDTKLDRLHIGGFDGPLPDLTPLCGIPTLRHLHIWGDTPVDVSGLAGARDLEIQINGNTRRPVYGADELPESVAVKRQSL